MLKIKDLTFSYKKRKILDNLSFELSPGKIAALIGRSGSGKTTLFKLLTGMLPLQEGEIHINDHPLPNQRQDIAYMTQEDLLLPWKTVLGNTTLFSKSNKEQALALLREVGLENCAKMYPEALSGGMRQRVSLARTLAQQRPLLLLDEPFNSLDVPLREQIYRLLRQRKELSLLFITHDFRDAMELADHIFLLKEGAIFKEWEITKQSQQAILDDIRQHIFS